MTIVFPQGIAPAFVTSLFAFSIKSDVANGNLVWIVLIAICKSRQHILTFNAPLL